MNRFDKHLPVYLQKDNIKLEEGNFSQHFHNRPSNFYETTVFFGITGFTFILNLIQSLAVVFVIWGIILYAKHLTAMMDYFGNNKIILVAVIPITIIYFICMVLITTLNMRWYTIISSIEMNRDEECINRVINSQKKKASEISESVFRSFKKIFYDIKLKKYLDQCKDNISQSFEFALGSPDMQNIINVAFERFKKFTGSPKDEFEEQTIEIKDELKYFLKSTGNRLDDNQIDFMLHLIIDFDKEKGELTKIQLSEIWGAVVNFGKYTPQEIFFEVLRYYYESNKGVADPASSSANELHVGNIDDMLVWFEGYFTNDQIQFIKTECSYLGLKNPASYSMKKLFSKEAFVYMLVGDRRYHAY